MTVKRLKNQKRYNEVNHGEYLLDIRLFFSIIYFQNVGDKSIVYKVCLRFIFSTSDS